MVTTRNFDVHENINMVNFCCVVGCSNRSNRDKDVSFYCIPTVLERQGDHAAKLSKERRERWLSNIKRKGYEPAKSSRVCSEHLVRGKPAHLHDIANPDWTPTQKMGYTSCHSSSVSAFHRYERSQQRNRKADNMAPAAILLELHNASPEQCPIHEQIPPVGGTETQTELSFRDIRALEKNVEELQKDNIVLRTQVCDLEEKIRATGLQEEHLQNNDAKLRFYTGLPCWAIFLPLFTFTSRALPT
uniref:THAP domain-containing protein 1-like n=1 Tax=Myxine glutinosa TaxID=7769 RepID=UPI00358E3415